MADGIQTVTMPFAALLGYDTDAERVGILCFMLFSSRIILVVTKKWCIFAAECCTWLFENKFSLRLFA